MSYCGIYLSLGVYFF